MQQSTGYEYDSQGRLWKILDAKNQSTEYGYDGQGRFETISYADGRSVTLSYDANGNLAGYDDGVTSASYTYDALGRKLSETVNYGTFSKSFSYTYHPSGQKQNFTAPDGTVYEYAYGQNNELREVTIPGLGAITIAEYQWNRPTTVLYPGGGKQELEYDGLMRLKTLTAKDPGGNALLEYGYEYDGQGNIVSKSTEHGDYAYGYDGASRLTSASNPSGDDESYAYDAVGNRTAASNATGSISHNANNELLGYGEIEFLYDENGNMIQKKLGTVAVNYIYNADNRLIRVEDELSGTVIAEYSYDPFGRRLWKDVAGVRTYFFYSDEGLIAEYDSSGNELKSYGYQPDSTWTTDPLFLKQNGSYYFYQNDHLGTPQKLVAQNGAVVWSAQYAVFGEATVSVETITNNLRFPGQYFDAETGWHYNFQRYYDPGIGRYVSVDPAGLKGGLNLFAYTFNNPGAYSDPHGLGIHPQHVVPPDEAYAVVLQAVTGGFEHEIHHQLGKAGNDDLQWLYNDSGYSDARTILRLLGNFVVKPGGYWVEGKLDGHDVRYIVSGWRNRFIFTCKYGWIDMGHFFGAAEIGYGLAANLSQIFPDSLLAHGGEIWQWMESWGRERGYGTLESVYTVEDLLSNTLGLQFGREVAQEDRVLYYLPQGTVSGPRLDQGFLLSIAEKWRKFLIESGAVHYNKKSDKKVYVDLQNDARLYWEADCYLITHETLETLRDEGIPDAVVAPLTNLLDERVCNDEEFRAYLRVYIGVEQAAAYGDRILAAAHQEREAYPDKDFGDSEWDAVYDDNYRCAWDDVKCHSLAYKKYCCECEADCLAGICQDYPLKEQYRYDPSKNF